MRLKALISLSAATLSFAVLPGPASSQPTEAEPVAAEQPAEAMTVEDLRKFVIGNLLFLAYHELGHAIISEFDLPVIGREEDAVDRLAIWMMTPDEITEETVPEFLINAIFGWMTVSLEKSLDQIAWWGQHGTEEQRGFQAACLLYGDNPQIYKAVADGVDLPKERRESCVKESQQNSKSWVRMIEPHFRPPEEVERMPADAVTVDYAPSQEYADARGFLMEIGILEELERLVRVYNFKPGVTLRTQECGGEPNAFWREKQRTLTICYELAQQYYKMVEPALDEIDSQSAGQ